MVTQEWTIEESEKLLNLGFTTNFKGFFIKKINESIITLTKRLDVEFNELYYQAYDELDGLQISIPVYRVQNAFLTFIQSVQDELLCINNLMRLKKALKTKNINFDIINNENDFTILINEKETKIDGSELEVENKILYLTINELLK